MLREDAEGVVLTVRVKPRARRNSIIGMRNDALLVEVTAPPEQNKANDAVIALLAEALNISKSRVELLSGQTHRDKRLRIWGLTPSQCWERLQVVLGQRP